MTVLNILRDGTVLPALGSEGLMVKLLDGNIQVGKFSKILYQNKFENYIVEPHNALEIKKELIKRINNEMPEVFSRHYEVHLLCPKNISSKVRW